jgi:DNA replication and repair protein RecF
MIFSGTRFRNFRNIASESREWPPGFNVISGPNGAGKTNFLEGVNVLAGWGPFDRNARISGMINREAGTDEAAMWGAASGEEPAEIFVSLGAKRQLKCDGKAIAAAEMRRKIPVLAFLPEHMSLIGGSASFRRRLLDMTGALLYVSYARVLHDYRVVLKKKAAMLKRRAETRAADRLLSNLAAWLWEARAGIVRKLRAEIGNFSSLLPGGLNFFFVRGGGGLDDNPADDFRKSVSLAGERERRYAVPLVGPQRDDVRFMCKDVDAASALSRGQSRRLASALVMASALAVEHGLGRKPVLIFDELYSELDEEGRRSETAALKSTGCQVFAASADAPSYEGVEIFRMKDGRFL